ncbi:hypothetical protein F383_25477 [Gossypium arboreum]|nr:hypothetical protein F383_25477 [Gossypium arboreum]
MSLAPSTAAATA